MECLTHLENAQHWARNVKCENKNHFSTCCRSKQPGARNRKSHSTSRGHEGKGKPPHSRSRSKSVTKSAHSIESTSFQDHSDDLHGESADPHGDQQGNLHGTNFFQDHQESTDFVKKSFSTIYRSKSVASISNNTDPEGKTKILTILGENDQISTSFKTIAKRVKNLNPHYMVPIDEVSQVISDPQSRKKAQPVT